MRLDGSKIRDADVVLGEDWIGPDAAAESELRAKREQRGIISINRSPLARKIITFNLLAILVLVCGVLFLNPFRDSLVYQREKAIVSEAELIAGFIGYQFDASEGPTDLAGPSADLDGKLSSVELTSAASLFVYDPAGNVIDVHAGVLGSVRVCSHCPELESDSGLE